PSPRYPVHRTPPSIPTRRSSDLHARWRAKWPIGCHAGTDAGTDACPGADAHSDRGAPANGDTSNSDDVTDARNCADADRVAHSEDRKSTRLNSSHEWISYAVFCL